MTKQFQVYFFETTSKGEHRFCGFSSLKGAIQGCKRLKRENPHAYAISVYDVFSDIPNDCVYQLD